MTFSESIKTLRNENFSDEEILQDIQKIRPDLSDSIKILAKEGFRSSEIVDDIGTLELGEVEKKKLGVFGSALAGVGEGILGIGALGEGIANFLDRNKAVNLLHPNPKYEDQKNYSLDLMQQIPESETEAGRRARIGTRALTSAAPFGPLAAATTLIGSQVGQTIREVFGNEGKFDSFGIGEAFAIGADVVTSLGTSIFADVISQAPRISSRTVSQLPRVFEEGQSRLQNASIRSIVQGEKTALHNTIENLGTQQIQGFEQAISQISPIKFTQVPNANVATYQRLIDEIALSSQLNIISPIATTTEQGGLTLQGAANNIFNETVIQAERLAYGEARAAAEGLIGEAPRTISQAKLLRNNLLRNNPTPEQQPIIVFLNELINDLETHIPGETTITPSNLITGGRQVTRTTPDRLIPTPRPANDLVDLVQRSNQSLSYGSQLREQSHRLRPIIQTLREEVRETLAQNPQAATLYQEANNLHAVNAETWGTKFMKDVRFSENPEKIVSKFKLASNMRNYKQAVPDDQMQALAERLIINQIHEQGTAKANTNVFRQLFPELSPNARQIAQNLIDSKDPLTTVGNRLLVRNEILKEAVESVTSGQAPKRILELMNTPKGYLLVRDSMSGSPQSMHLFRTFERKYIEDLFNSVLDKSGRIDFSKAQNIMKNNDTGNVVRLIGGDRLFNQFRQLETFSSNLTKNLEKFKDAKVVSFLQTLKKEGKEAIGLGAILHMLHVPTPILVGLGLTKGLIRVGGVAYNKVKNSVLQNPKAMRYLEQLSLANTPEKIIAVMPKLINEISTKESEESID